jgi:hypothetical protein
VDTIKKNTETLIDASKKVDLEVNTVKTKYILLFHRQNAGQNHEIKIANRRFENVAHFRYLGMTVINQNLIHGEIKRRLKSGNACYRSVKNFCLLKIRIFKTIILPVVLHGCEIWSLTLREEYRLRVFENSVLRRIFGSKRN